MTTALNDAISCRLCVHFTLNGSGVEECTQPHEGRSHQRGNHYNYRGFGACKASLPLGVMPPHFQAKEVSEVDREELSVKGPEQVRKGQKALLNAVKSVGLDNGKGVAPSS